jgi:GTP-sensing pleiotropic transcriptional regulator CodY
MSVQLLDRTRKINKLLHNSSSSKVVFNDICQVLMETLSSNILVLSKKGKVLGVSLCPGVEEITELIEDKVGGYVDSLLNERFLGVLSTKENVNLQHFNVGSFHTGRSGFNHTGTFKLPQSVYDNRSGDSHAVCDLTCNQDSLISVKFIKNMDDRLQFGER